LKFIVNNYFVGLKVLFQSDTYFVKKVFSEEFSVKSVTTGGLMYKSHEISAAYLDYFVSFAKAGHVCRRIWIHFANVLARPILLCMEVEAVALEVRPLDDMTKTRPRR
jgi:hypothetical protein